MEYAPTTYFASGPNVDPIRHVIIPVRLDDIAEDNPAAAGWARLVGWLLDGQRPIATYCLVIGGDELCSLFTRVGRRFDPIEVT
jgi:hypothetical protein